MPPIVPLYDEPDSGTDSSGGDIPAQSPPDEKEAVGPSVEGPPRRPQEDSESKAEDSDSEEDEDLYEVETIRSHRFFKGELLLSVKWKGYPDEQNTEESVEMLKEGASEILEQYFTSIGGHPQPPGKPSKRKSSASLKANADSPAPKKSKRLNGEDGGEKADSWVPKKSNWENEIISIDTVERDPETGKLWALIHFSNKRRSKVGMDLVHRHCPLAMLKFYENHLKFM